MTNDPQDTSARQKYDRKFQNILSEIMDIARGPKTADYGETWARTGLLGIYIKIMIKEGRLRQLIWGKKKAETKGESVRDTLIDIAAYAVYGIIAYDEENMDGGAERKQHLRVLLQEMTKMVEEDENA